LAEKKGGRDYKNNGMPTFGAPMYAMSLGATAGSSRTSGRT
jgi:hypothetical protein